MESLGKTVMPPNPETDTLTQDIKKIIQRQWPTELNSKTTQYIGKFFARIRKDKKIVALVEGNHGTYTVSIDTTQPKQPFLTCSCYIGKGGYCHHCRALAITFLNEPDSFVIKVVKKWEEVNCLADVSEYLEGITLEELLNILKAQGITQKAFAESIGCSSQHLTAVKTGEKRNRFYHELGATKLACLWVLENYGKTNNQ